MIVQETHRQAARRTAARSRAETLKRGLATESAMTPPESFRTRSAQWHTALQPADPTQAWFADEAVRITLKLDHASKVDQALREQSAIRAETCWDLDRRAEAEALARNITRRPAETVISLRRTVQGCDYLIERWAMLAYLADQNGHWDEPQVGMVFDLLGTPREVRAADPCRQIDDDGRLVDPPTDPAAFARLQLAALRSVRSNLEPLDDHERESAINDLADPPTPAYARFRRYEAALQTRLKWCLKQIKADRPDALVTPPKPKAIAPPVMPSRTIEDDNLDIDDDEGGGEDEPTDDQMVAWFRAEATKAGFTDLDALLPTRAERDLIRTGGSEPRRHRA